MNEDKIRRINELARKKKTVGLTEGELMEQQALRRAQVCTLSALFGVRSRATLSYHNKAFIHSVPLLLPDCATGKFAGAEGSSACEGACVMVATTRYAIASLCAPA